MPSMGIRRAPQHIKEQPNLIILDLGLPAGDGFVVLDRLQRDDKLSNIPVIVLTARDPQGNEQRALRAGATAFFRSRRTTLNCWM
jgi:CheY-like chemotaxis protein